MKLYAQVVRADSSVYIVDTPRKLLERVTTCALCTGSCLDPYGAIKECYDVPERRGNRFLTRRLFCEEGIGDIREVLRKAIVKFRYS
ncbi:unnamed protein product, partial [Iphiclides podalirius]